MSSASLIVLAGAFAGGFVSGLTGFGTGMTAMPIWLLGVGPMLAAPLVVACSLVAQVQTLPAIWHAIDYRRCAPFVLGGLAGVPFGAYVLPYIPIQAFKAGVGALLVGYCAFNLASGMRWRVLGGGKVADTLIGLGGGVLGGLAGMSGPLPTIWAGLRGSASADEYKPLHPELRLLDRVRRVGGAVAREGAREYAPMPLYLQQNKIKQEQNTRQAQTQARRL